MAQSRRVCCCGADSWTKVIAWLQIICSIIGTLHLTIHFISVVRSGATSDLLYNIRFPNMFLQIAVIILFVIIFGVSGLVMGYFLLKGANKRNPNYLKAWIIYTIICLAWNTLYNLISMVSIFIIVTHFWITFTFTCFEIIITTFLLWVVFIFAQEIEADESGAAQVTYKV